MAKSKTEIKKELDGRYFGKTAKTYNRNRSTDVRDRDVLDREVQIVQQFLRNSKKGKILDVGCGTGRIFPFYGNREIYGVDISKDMLDIAKKNHPKAHFKISDAEKLPFPSNSFPVVITSRFICHTPNYEKAIKEIARVAQPGGSILIDFPNKYSLSFFSVKMRIMKGRIEYFNLFTHSDIVKIAKDNNLEIAEIEGKIVVSAKLFLKPLHGIIKSLNARLVGVFPGLSYPRYVRFVKKSS